MTKAVFASISGTAPPAGSDRGSPSFAATNAGTTTFDVGQEVYIGIAGTISNARIVIDANGTSRTFRSRKNGANGNILIQPANGASGSFEDTTNSDTVAVGDTFGWLSNVTTTACLLSVIQADFEASSGHGHGHASQLSGTYAASTTYYLSFIGRNSNVTDATTEANAQDKVCASGTARRMSWYVNSNSSTSTITARFRKNGANGNQTFTIASGTTGRFTDTTNTDSVAVDDLINMMFSGQNNTLQPGRVNSIFITSDGSDNNLFAHNISGWSRAASATTHYWAIVSLTASATNTTESIVQTKLTHTITNSKLKVKVTTNSYTSAVNIKFRKNGADGNQSVSVSAGATGWFEDSTNTDDLVNGDLINLAIAGGTSGTLDVRAIASRMGPAAGGGARSQAFMM